MADHPPGGRDPLVVAFVVAFVVAWPTLRAGAWGGGAAALVDAATGRAGERAVTLGCAVAAACCFWRCAAVYGAADAAVTAHADDDGPGLGGRDA